jgi:hypothetical protein
MDARCFLRVQLLEGEPAIRRDAGAAHHRRRRTPRQARIVLAHNHPSGTIRRPSEAPDCLATRRLARAAEGYRPSAILDHLDPRPAATARAIAADGTML